MKLLIVRHGQTEDNVQGIIQGHKDTPLNDHGRMESRRLAERLKGLRIVEAWSSPLCRAAETAQIVLQYHPEVALQLHDGLKERGLGSMEGRRRARGEHAPADAEPQDALLGRAAEWFNSFLSSHIPAQPLPSRHSLLDHLHIPHRDRQPQQTHQANGDSLPNGHASDAAERSGGEEGEEVILIVSHGAWIAGFLRLVYSNIYKFQLSRTVDPHLPCYNTSIMTLICEYDVYRLKWRGLVDGWADVNHLKGLMDEEVDEVADDVSQWTLGILWDGVVIYKQKAEMETNILTRRFG